jgi:hypothetical protein
MRIPPGSKTVVLRRRGHAVVHISGCDRFDEMAFAALAGFAGGLIAHAQFGGGLFE